MLCTLAPSSISVILHLYKPPSTEAYWVDYGKWWIYTSWGLLYILTAIIDVVQTKLYHSPSQGINAKRHRRDRAALDQENVALRGMYAMSYIHWPRFITGHLCVIWSSKNHNIMGEAHHSKRHLMFSNQLYWADECQIGSWPRKYSLAPSASTICVSYSYTQAYTRTSPGGSCRW